MPDSNWVGAIPTGLNQLWSGVAHYAPAIVVAVLIFIIGWLIGKGLGRVVEQIINSLRVDQALRAIGVGRVVSRAGFELSAGKFVGFLVEWFIIIAFLVASLQIVGLTQVNQFLTSAVLGYLPLLIVAVLILLVAAVLANAADRVVSGSARAAGLSSAGFLGKVARYAIWVFAIFAALDQLQIAVQFVQTLFTGIVIAVSLAIGLAFGLGGQSAAARYLEKLHMEIKD